MGNTSGEEGETMSTEEKKKEDEYPYEPIYKGESPELDYIKYIIDLFFRNKWVYEQTSHKP